VSEELSSHPVEVEYFEEKQKAVKLKRRIERMKFSNTQTISKGPPELKPPK